MSKSDLEAEFLEQWHRVVPHLPAPEREYEFSAERRYRLDFAFVDQRVGVEIMGGTWIVSGHSTGRGIRRDCEKRNLLTLMGWRVLDFTTDMLREEPVGCINAVVDLIQPLKRGRGVIVSRKTEISA